MADVIDTLHPENDLNTNLYPNIVEDNIPAGAVSRNKLAQGAASYDKLSPEVQGLINGKVNGSSTDGDEYPTNASITNANGQVAVRAYSNVDDKYYDVVEHIGVSGYRFAYSYESDHSNQTTIRLARNGRIEDSIDETDLDSGERNVNSCWKTSEQTQESVYTNVNGVTAQRTTRVVTHNSITEHIFDDTGSETLENVSVRQINRNMSNVGDSDDESYARVTQTRTMHTLEVVAGQNSKTFKVDVQGAYIDNKAILTTDDLLTDAEMTTLIEEVFD